MRNVLFSLVPNASTVVGVLCCCLVLTGSAVGMEKEPDNARVLAEALEDCDCSLCHTCEFPTAEDPCMKACEFHAMFKAEVSEETGPPDVFIMDELSELYVPVVFPHKLHADMERMGQGCVVCHHHNPPGPVLRCKEYHGGPSNPSDLSRPGLKGAYHRQCLGCHREWSHETDCVICHAKREPGVEVTPTIDTTDIMGSLHPNIEEPDTWVYKTDLAGDGTVVTFHHHQHVHLFGYDCVDCHQEESCGRCHDSANRSAHVREEPHEDCDRCHAEVDDQCEHCHLPHETKGFDHAARSGFVLKRYHADLTCQQCHGDIHTLSALNPNCGSCHGDGTWTPESFDHSKTGLSLDENHVDLDCDMCHEAGLGKKATCDFCHDDGRTTPPVFPGTWRQ